MNMMKEYIFYLLPVVVVFGIVMGAPIIGYELTRNQLWFLGSCLPSIIIIMRAAYKGRWFDNLTKLYSYIVHIRK